MPRTPKQPQEPAAEQPKEPKKPNPPATPPLQPLQIIKKGTSAIPPKPPEKPPEQPPETPPAVEAVKPAGPEAAGFPTRPKPAIRKPIPKAEIPVIEKATGANGDVFIPGDRVEITEPFGSRVAALIDSFYADTNGEIWVRVKPVEVNPNCRWDQGCLRSEGLVRVPE